MGTHENRELRAAGTFKADEDQKQNIQLESTSGTERIKPELITFYCLTDLQLIRVPNV